ncbi:MAG: glutaredoxin [Myxococcales bacterium]|nr:glutaredoxin [Myxococcales bacterium]
MRPRLEALKQRAIAAFELADEKGGDLRDELLRRGGRVAEALAKWRAQRRRSEAAAPVEAAFVEPQRSAVATNALPPLGEPQQAAQVFGRTTCPWTQRALDLLKNQQVDTAYVDLTDDAQALLKARLEADTKQYTVPYVYLRGQFIGGYNALAEIERLGQLQWRIMTEAEQAAAPAHYKRVEVVARQGVDEIAPAENAEPAILE